MHIDFLFEVFKEFNSSVSIIWKDKEYSYKHLTKNINKNLLLVESHQIKKGTVVAVEGDFSPNSIALLLSLIEKACIVVPINNSTNFNRKKLYKISQVEHVFSISNNDEITSTKIGECLQLDRFNIKIYL